MAFSYINSWLNDGGSETSSAIDTSGANLLVAVFLDVAPGYVTFSDSKSNTWAPAETVSTGGGEEFHVVYCENGTVGSGHTFTASGLGIFYGTVFAFAGGGGGFDDAVGAGDVDGNNTAQSGSITPAESGEVFVVYNYGYGDVASSLTTDSGFTETAEVNLGGGGEAGFSSCYKIKTDATSENPTTTGTSWSSTDFMFLIMAAFKAAVAAQIPFRNRMQQYLAQ